MDELSFLFAGRCIGVFDRFLENLTFADDIISGNGDKADADFREDRRKFHPLDKQRQKQIFQKTCMIPWKRKWRWKTNYSGSLQGNFENILFRLKDPESQDLWEQWFPGLRS